MPKMAYSLSSFFRIPVAFEKAYKIFPADSILARIEYELELIVLLTNEFPALLKL